MRRSNSIKVDRCDVFEETFMVQNATLCDEDPRGRTEVDFNTRPIRYRATKPPMLYPVTEKRVTRSPLSSSSSTVSVTFFIIKISNNSGLSIISDAPLLQPVHPPNPLRHTLNYLL